MTFQQRETSDFLGQPVGLYRIQWGNSIWTFNTSAREFVVDGVTFVPQPVVEKPFVQGSREPEYSIEIPASHPVCQLFRGTPPAEPVVLTVYRIHFEDPDAEPKILWQGPTVTCKDASDGVAKELVSRSRGMRRGGLRLTWSRTCPHPLFGYGCALSKADFALERTITAIAGNVITLNALSPAAKHFDGGFIEWDADGLGTPERRTIEIEISAGQYRLFGRADGLEVGQVLNAYPGCDHSMATCIAKFDNQDNHGGVDFMPGQSPFSGQALM